MSSPVEQLIAGSIDRVASEFEQEFASDYTAPRFGRYVGERILAPGGAGICGAQKMMSRTSTVWFGHDRETGERIVLKAYHGHRSLYENEVAVHHELADSARLVRMLAHDDDQWIVVKAFVPGTVGFLGVACDSMLFALGATVPEAVTRLAQDARGRRLRPYSVERVRALLADIMSVVADAARKGRIADHALGGWARTLNESGTFIGAAESNVIIGDQGATVIDLCNLPSGRWLPADLAHSATVRALWLHRFHPLAPSEKLLTDISEMSVGDRTDDCLQEQISAAHTAALKVIDPDLSEVIARSSEDPCALHAAIVRVAHPPARSRQERRLLQRKGLR